MGKVEKVIVLSVLFLIALILVVSLTVDDPLNKIRVVEAGAPLGKPATSDRAASLSLTPGAQSSSTPFAPAAPDPNVAAARTPVATSPLLSATVQTQAPADAAHSDLVEAAPAPAGDPSLALVAPALPTGALLRSLQGLEDSILPDMKLYTWKENDSYRSIADRYYGHWEKFTVLRRSNEGRNDVKPGQKIFVPVFDSDASAVLASEAAAVDPVHATTKKGGKKTVATVAAATDETIAKEPKVAGKKSHLVKEGESLWKISKDELGDGGRWKEIFDLNKDVLAKPESVHKGQRLRIP